MIHVACAADEAYAPYCAAMLHSLFTRHPAGTVTAHFLHGPGFAPLARERLARLAATHAQALRLHEIADAEVAGLPEMDRIPRLMWYRVLLPDLLPELERVLYVDADTLVVDRLEALWETDLAGFELGAVANVMPAGLADHPRALGMAAGVRYFNSGVLLLHLAAMRSSRASARILELARRDAARLRWPDQDALNLVLAAHCRWLHPRWNCQNTLFYWRDARAVFGDAASAEATRHPGIIHFEGPGYAKPWHDLNTHPWRAQYWRHLRATPFPAPAPAGRTFLNVLRRRAKVAQPLAPRSPTRADPMPSPSQSLKRVARALLPAALLDVARRVVRGPPVPVEEPPFQYPFWQTMAQDPGGRPPYRWGTLCAAQLAQTLGIERISVIELGVAGGNGLLELERVARDAERRSGVKLDVYGFDTGSGMARPQDYRDLPQMWGEGFYRMDVEALQQRLTSARLILGPVERTIPEFVASAPAPVGFVAFDMDMYHPTLAAFDLFRGDATLVLPRVTCYFDDLIGFSHGDCNGERLAIHDFNRENARRQISKIYGLRYVLKLDQWWTEQMFMLHAFDHPRYTEHDGWNRLRELPLVAG